MKVMVIVGTRPEVIKMAPVIQALRDAKLEAIVCATGQHREMLAQALDVFGITPDIALDVMSPGQSLNILSARLLEQLDRVLATEAPDWVLVQGDTTTAFCGGLAAFHRGIKVGHVEAGLRTGDLSSPFPEEANRSLLGRIATLHFAPTQSAAQALRREGVDPQTIKVTGNTVVDAIKLATQAWIADTPKSLSPEIKTLVQNRPTVLVTCHRRENFGGVLEGICGMLARLCADYPDHQWIFPVHLNPSVQQPVLNRLAGIPNLRLIDPIDYHTNLYLISQAHLVVSDSGGIQEEAPAFGTPAVVMRRHTERMEGVDAGFATLAGQDSKQIEQAARSWLNKTGVREQLKQRPNPYGDGLASKRILTAIHGLDISAFEG